MTDIDEARLISFPRARGMDKQSETDCHRQGFGILKSYGNMSTQKISTQN